MLIRLKPCHQMVTLQKNDHYFGPNEKVRIIRMTRTQMTLTNVNVGISMEISIVDYLIIYWMAST